VGTLEAIEGDGSTDAPARVLLRIGANELDWIARYVAALPFA